MEEPCYTCRRRRIRCDQSRSPCAKCTTSGLQCFTSRPLRWVAGVAIRGKMRGVSFENTSDDSTKGASAQNQFGPKDGSLPAVVSVFTAVGPFGQLDPVSRYYLDYYNDRICKLFIVYDSEKNPFRALISLSLLDRTLLKSVLALAARHRVNRDCSFHDLTIQPPPGPANAQLDALRFKYQAIQGISKDLGDSTSGKKDTTVASIFLLIFLDLLESGSDRWNVHLEGAKRLMDFNLPEPRAGSRHDPGQTVQEIRNFLASQIYSIETLGGTFVRPKLLSQFDLLRGPQFQETVEQSFLGCPEYLLDAIRYLSARRDAITCPERHDDSTFSYFVENTVMMIDFIQQFDCSVWASSLLLNTTGTGDIGSLCTLARTYQIGALIYGKRVLGALTKECLSLEDLVQELIDAISSLQDDNALYKCILWPIFIAALECHQPEQRETLLCYMEKFWDCTSCVNAINAAKIIKDHWEKSDGASSQWIFSIGYLGRDWLLI
ncbi:hypothetical protein BO94DRAFT_614476 [Aspergillus sclerotioniger CBS 115572]|uniref:Zn(2)-C6 fungal-type domain-containing protein n=1 Tax=Aspergillus sclerotioniger CBS 115572 TaxID=1450535 RepID=A0A317X4B4_9EURO|nr:hypothetical protein BO94DRAFT_614476 [Aspergillus sclerotioniger CBS 115572]PWY93406.1 hypothetical protein BO94DRAFT_614476 [Aspergillus sclerotioniger CBS 115572]